MSSVKIGQGKLYGVTCFNCGEVGHRMVGCAKLKAQQSGRVGSRRSESRPRSRSSSRPKTKGSRTPFRSRSQSRERKSSLRGVSNKAPDHHVLKFHLDKVRPLLSRREEIKQKIGSFTETVKSSGTALSVKDAKEDLKKGWFSVATEPVKPPSDLSPKDIAAMQEELKMIETTLQAARDALRAGYGNRPFRIGLWRETSSASSSGAALTTVTTLDITAFTEWSSCAALFDICRCVGLTVHIGVQMAHATAAAETYWNIAYDPENSGVFGSLTTSLASIYKTGPQKISAASTAVATHYCSTPSGCHILRVPSMPMIIPDQSTATNVYTGDWVDTVTTNIGIGYLKPYINSMSGGTSAASYLIEAHMEFKLRS